MSGIISRKPGGRKKKSASAILKESEVENLINKGGEVPKEKKPAKRTKKAAKPDKKVPVQLRLPQSLIDVIDDHRSQRLVRVSRHTWFLEAIEEKLRKEQEAL